MRNRNDQAKNRSEEISAYSPAPLWKRLRANHSTNQTPPKAHTQEPTSQKNPAAVALGKLAGKKGGIARRDKLTAEQRKAIAQKAVRTRWQSK
jgi:hypothetical protein